MLKNTENRNIAAFLMKKLRFLLGKWFYYFIFVLELKNEVKPCLIIFLFSRKNKKIIA
jgi:hypothetical protein